MFSSDILTRLDEQRRGIWLEMQHILDTAEKQKRGLSVGEEGKYNDLSQTLDEIDERKRQITAQNQRNAAVDAAFEELMARPVAGGHVEPSDKQVDQRFRDAILRRDPTPIDVTWQRRSGVQPGLERRDLLTTSGSGLTPTSFWGTLERHLVEGSAIMAAGATMITTDSGETLKVPKSTAGSTAAIVAEGAAISESDPTLGSASLSAYKYAFMVQISRELAEDSSFDVASYLAAQAGDALANGAGAHFVTGTGSSQPSGAVTGATLGVTGGTGVAGAFTADNLIDLYHSVAEPYARSRSAAWLMRNTTLAAVRKLKDSQNRYLFDVNAPAGTGASGTLLGRPVFVDPNVAAIATSAKSVLFGDFSKYWVRSVRGIRFDRSDDFAFSSDLVSFRAIWRADGVLVDQTGAVKYFAGAAT